MKYLVIAALIAGSASLPVQAADPATVNGVAIKQSLVDFIAKDAAAQGKPADQANRANIVDKLISTELLAQEAVKSGITKQAEFLAKEELTLRELRVSAYVEHYLQQHAIDEQALQAEYDRLKALNASREYKASHILVNTESEAQALIARIQHGEDFAQLAKAHSLDSSKDAGGDIGWFSLDGVVEPFGNAVAKLQKGAISPAPVQTEYGWHVIRLDEARETPPPPYESVKEQLRNDLQRQQLVTLVNDLRAKANIVINPATK